MCAYTHTCMHAQVVLLIFIDVGNVLFVLVKYTDSDHEPLEHMVCVCVCVCVCKCV